MDLQQNFRKSALAYFTLIYKKLQGDFGQQLFAHANRAKSNSEERAYLEGMRSFKEHVEEFAVRYEHYLSKSFMDFFAGDDDANIPKHIEELSLVEKEELEDELALSIMSSRCSTKNAEALWKLNRRLAVVRGGKPVDDDCNPCGPSHLCQALRYAVAEWKIENKVKLQFYKAYDLALMYKAGELYEKLNDFLIGQKILPNLKYQVENKEATGKNAKAAQNQPNGGAAPTPPGSTLLPYITTLVWGNPQEEARQQELIDSVRGLQLTSSRGAARSNTASGVSFNGLTVGSGKNNSVTAFNPADYAFALSTLQQKLQLPRSDHINLAKSTESVEAELIDRLKQLAMAGDRARITDEDAVTIDLVGMLFRYVLDDPKLPDSVKSLISHLHTPFLKVALIDEDFFSNPQHAARRLLNLMAEIGSRWVTEGKNDRVVMPKLRGMVSKILQEFVDDVQLFEQCVNDLVEFARIMEKRAELAEKRNKEAQEGLERLAKARDAAIEAIEERVGDRLIPEAVQHWLEKPWTDFVAFNHIRHGGEGVAWEGALNVIDNVLASIDPESAETIVANEVKRNALFNVLEKGLNTIGYDADATDRLIRDIRQAQADAMRRAQSETSEIQQGERDSSAAVENIAANDETATAAPDEAQPELNAKSDSPDNVSQEDVAQEDVAQEDAAQNVESAKYETTQAESAEGELSESPDSSDGSTKGAIQRQLQSQSGPKPVADVAELRDVAKQKAAASKISNGETAVQRQLRLRRNKVNRDFTAEEEKRLGSLDFGDWFEFLLEGEKKPQKLKLAWFSSISDRYMFVNAVGVKSQVKSARELLEGFADGTICEVDDNEPTLLERAFDTILKGMRKVTSSAAPG